MVTFDELVVDAINDTIKSRSADDFNENKFFTTVYSYIQETKIEKLMSLSSGQIETEYLRIANENKGKETPLNEKIDLIAAIREYVSWDDGNLDMLVQNTAKVVIDEVGEMEDNTFENCASICSDIEFCDMVIQANIERRQIRSPRYATLDDICKIVYKLATEKELKEYIGDKSVIVKKIRSRLIHLRRLWEKVDFENIELDTKFGTIFKYMGPVDEDHYYLCKSDEEDIYQEVEFSDIEDSDIEDSDIEDSDVEVGDIEDSDIEDSDIEDSDIEVEEFEEEFDYGSGSVRETRRLT